ncbi:MAG: ATP-binding cassette domain-containing protein [Pseudomonadota bacterium]
MTTSSAASETTSDTDAPAEPLLIAEGIFKSYGRQRTLNGISVSFGRGELTAILGARGAGRTSLAAILAGQRLPDAGRVWRGGRVAPLIGNSAAFGVTGSVGRDLALRAAAAGIDGPRLAAAVAAFAGGPRILARPFERAGAVERTALLNAAAWLTPAEIYLADGPLMPGKGPLADALTPFLEDARKRAAVVWLTAGVSHLRAVAPDRILLLEKGQLERLPCIDTAIDRFENGTGKKRQPVRKGARANRTPENSSDQIPTTATAPVHQKSSTGELKPDAVTLNQAKEDVPKVLSPRRLSIINDEPAGKHDKQPETNRDTTRAIKTSNVSSGPDEGVTADRTTLLAAAPRAEGSPSKAAPKSTAQTTLGIPTHTTGVAPAYRTLFRGRSPRSLETEASDRASEGEPPLLLTSPLQNETECAGLKASGARRAGSAP